MTLWVVRAGKYGERENFDLENGVAVVGWDLVPDVSKFESKDILFNSLEEIYPVEKQQTLRNWAGMLWRFGKEIRVGDLIALPLKTRSAIYIGEVTGLYKYEPQNPESAKHTIKVNWKKEIPRKNFDNDLRHSLGSLLTVCSISRNNAEARVKRMLTGNHNEIQPQIDEVVEEELDIEQITSDQITTYIDQKFKGHELARLVGDILIAQGYFVRVSPAGPDGGVDILAGSGPLGLESPKLAVQVKSGSNPIDVEVLRSFAGVMDRFRAEHGLIVAWGGYKGNVERELVQEFFKIRLWDAGELVKNIQQYYEKLPESTQALLPMKRIWMLVSDEE
jgi:restriction system protein